MLHSPGLGGRLRVLVGFDIGGTKTAVVVGGMHIDGTTELLGREAFPTEPARGWRRAVDGMLARARALLAPVAEHPDAIGISCGGPLDSRQGLLLSPPNLPGWDRVPIAQALGSALGAPARLANDANACAVAEWRLGAGRGCRNMVFLTFGTGMGAGIIVDGRLYEGANDLAGEVGHVRLAEDGPEGYGKRGSFEGFCSGGGIARLARERADRALSQGETVGFCPSRADLDAVTARSVSEAAEAGDPLAIAILEESGRWLGRGLAMLIDVLNPERIVIGSIYARCRRLLEPAMRAEIAREALGPAAAACEVLPAALGEQLGDYACLAVAPAAPEGKR